MLSRSFLLRSSLSMFALAISFFPLVSPISQAADLLAPVPTMLPLPVATPQAPATALFFSSAPASSLLAKLQFPLNANTLAAQSLAQVPMNDAAAMIRFLNSQPNDLFWHVNAIYKMQEWSVSPKLAVTNQLRERQNLDRSSAEAAFDYGLAQMALNNNREGIVFLRKANEVLESQVSALVYAVAMAESERTFEKGKPDTINARKLDVVYKLNDAVRRDVSKHHEGFWPAFMQVVDTLKAMPAYKVNLTGDFSALYLPLGNRIPNYVAPNLALKEILPASSLNHLNSGVLPTGFIAESPIEGAMTSEIALATTDTGVLGQAPVPGFSTSIAKKTNFFTRRFQKRQAKRNSETNLKTNTELLVGQVPKALVERTDYIRFKENAPWIALHFLKPNVSFSANTTTALSLLGETQPSEAANILLVTPHQEIIGSLFSAVKPYIVEDLERDGVFEIVLRQANETPLTPVQVYRLQSNGTFAQDAAISRLFQ